MENNSKYDRDKLKEHQKLRGLSQYGKSYVYIICPFCGTKVRAFIWSLAGGGKKCPECKAIHTSYNVTIPLKSK